MSTHRTHGRTLAALGLLALLSVTGCGAGMPTSPAVDPSAGTVGSGASSMVLVQGDDNPSFPSGGGPVSSDTLVTQAFNGHGHGHGNGNGHGKKKP